MKVAIIVFGLFLLLIVGLFLLPYLIDLNRYQDRYRPLLEDALNRPVQLEHIRLTVFPRLGVRIAGLTILDDPAFDAMPFASLASLDIGIRFWPLLRGHVEVERVILQDPTITVIRNREGRLNVSTIGQPAAERPDVPPSPPGPADAGPVRLLALLAVDRITISNGTVTYRNQSTAKPIDYAFEHVQMSLESVVLGHVAHLHAAATLQPHGTPFAIEGTAGPLTETLEFQVVDFAISAGNARATLTGRIMGGRANLALTAPVLHSSDLPFASRLPPLLSIKDLLVEVESAYPLNDLGSWPEAVTIKTVRAALVLGASIMNVQGSMHRGKGVATATSSLIRATDLSIPLPGSKPADIKDLHVEAEVAYPPRGGVPLDQAVTVTVARAALQLGASVVALSGSMAGGRATIKASTPLIKSADLPLARPLSKPIEIRDLLVEADVPYPKDGGIPRPNTITVKRLRTTFGLGRSSLHVTGSMAGGRGTLTATAPRISTTDLPVALPFRKGVEARDIKLVAKLRDQHVTVEPVSLKVFGGRMGGQARTTWGSENPPFDATISLHGMQLSQLVDALSETVTITGNATGHMALQGQGFSLPQLTSALQGTGALTVKDGTIQGMNLVQEAVSLLKAVGVSIDPRRATPFSSADGRFRIGNGVLTLERLVLDSRDVRATAEGTVGFDQTLHVKAMLDLSESLSRQIAAGTPVARLAMPGGRLSVPLIMTGTVHSPVYALDSKAVAGAIEQQVKERVGDLLKDQGVDLKKGKELFKQLFGN